MWDDTGYDLTDPKHPTYTERVVDYIDQIRKAEKENAADKFASECTCDGEGCPLD